MMKKVVSVTPVSINADTRTFKQTLSCTRKGYEVTVVEFYGSMSSSPYPFPVVSVTPPPAIVAINLLDKGTEGSLFSRMRHQITARYRDSLFFIIVAAAVTLCSFLHKQLKTYRSLPTADVYVSHHYILSPAIFLKCFMGGGKVIYDAHDYYAEADFPAGKRRFERIFLSRFYRTIEARCVRRAHEVMTVSEGVAGLIEERFGRKPIIVRNVQDLRQMRSVQTGLREKIGLTGSEVIIVVIGNAKKGMAFEGIRDALSRLEEHFHVAFVGRGYAEYEDLFAIDGLRQRVHFTGGVQPDEVVNFVRTADISLLAYYPRNENYRYCLPNGFFQSISAGLPLIYPDLPEIRRIADVYELGIMADPLDPALLAQAVQALSLSPERMQLHRTNAAKAGTELNWEQEERLFLGAIEKALRERLVYPGDQC